MDLYPVMIAAAVTSGLVSIYLILYPVDSPSVAMDCSHGALVLCPPGSRDRMGLLRRTLPAAPPFSRRT